MPTPDEEGSNDTEGGISILGQIAAYQEKFGGSHRDIMKMPYLMMLIKSIDVLRPKYGDKKKTTEKKKKGFGTPLKDLPLSDQKKLK